MWLTGTTSLLNLTGRSTGTIDLTAVASATVPTITVGSSTQKIVNESALQTYLGTYATTAYVDSAVQGLDAKASVKWATGVVITITARTSSTVTIGTANYNMDGTNIANGERVLVKDGTTGVAGAGTADNGIFTVSGVGTSIVLTRATDMDAWAEIPSAYTWVEQGTLNADTGWVCTADVGGTVGTTAITWTLFSSAGSFIAGAGLTKTGNTIDVVGTTNRIVANANSIDIDAAYVGQTSITTLGTITAGTWTGTTIALANGGTGATTASGARTNLGAVNIAGDTMTGSLQVNSAIAMLGVKSTGTTPGQIYIDTSSATNGGAVANLQFKSNGVDKFHFVATGNGTDQFGLQDDVNSNLTVIQYTASSQSLQLGTTAGSVTLQGSGGVTAPTPAAGDSSTKVATTAFVTGLGAKLAARVATTAQLTISGRTATTLTIGGTALTLDGITLSDTNRVLVKDGTSTNTGTSSLDNGVYTVGGTGSSIVLTRAADWDSTADFAFGSAVRVYAGIVNSYTEWTFDASGGSITVGTTAVTWVETAINERAQTFAGAKTFTSDVTVQKATPTLNLLGTTTTVPTLILDSATGDVTNIKMTKGGAGRITFASSGTGFTVRDEVGTINFLSYTAGTKDLSFTAATTVTAPTVATATDSSTNVATTAFAQTAMRRLAVTAVAGSSGTQSLTLTNAHDVVTTNLTSTAVGQITLPAAATAGTGRAYSVKDIAGTAGNGVNVITIVRSGSDTIDGTAGNVTPFTTGKQAMSFISDGVSSWHII